jgi:hypothetical protein
MPFHYTSEDRGNGYITARDRTHNMKKIPLMTISIAVANSSRQSEFKNAIEINEKVAEVKRYLKTFEGSKFMADRRSDKARRFEDAHVYKTKRPAGRYRPLGQILIDSRSISADKLDEALLVHWRRGFRLGEVLSELGFVSDKDLAKALKDADADIN